MSVFSAELQSKIEGYLSRYETRRSSILPILHAIQDECGWIKDEHVQGLQAEYDLHEVQVREVLTFYTMYRTEPPKPYQILFCDNLVCCMMGANDVMERIQGQIDAAEAASPGSSKFSLEGVPCLGVCDGAPAMLVNKDRYLKVTPDNVDEILRKYDG